MYTPEQIEACCRQFNIPDYLHCNDPSGDFRAVYVLSDDPLRFDYRQITPFDFVTELPTSYAPTDWVEKRPVPIGIELIARGAAQWLVAYFRWHLGRFRLFFGALDWERSPARLEEIVSAARLQAVMTECRPDDDCCRECRA
jgi:hypothetical protein